MDRLIFGITVYPLGAANIHKANIREYPRGVKFIFIPARKGIRAFHYSIEPVSVTVGEYVRPRQFSTDLN